jgi:hypothetical protein
MVHDLSPCRVARGRRPHSVEGHRPPSVAPGARHPASHGHVTWLAPDGDVVTGRRRDAAYAAVRAVDQEVAQVSSAPTDVSADAPTDPTAVVPAEPAHDRPAAPSRGRRALSALAPAAVYVVVRLVGVAVLGLMTGSGEKLVTALNAWDGTWMVAIARYGYAGIPDDMLDAFGNHTPDTARAFFPGYPAAIAAVGRLTGGDLVLAGLVVSLVAGVVGAYGLTRLGELVPGGSRKAGLLLVGLFAAAPMGVVLSMTYTEALFCALTAWSLVGVLQRRWLLAGLFALAAGLVRPTATALIAAVGLAALVAIIRRRDGWRPWIGLLLAPCGVLGYLGYVALATGQLDGWGQIQRAGWASYLDGGASTAEFIRDALAGGSEVYDLAIVLALAASVVLVVLAIRTRVPWPLVVYGVLVLLLVWGSNGPAHSKLRLLVPAFTLLLPVAIGLARRRTGTAVAVVAAAALASAWFGGYALTIWHYGI